MNWFIITTNSCNLFCRYCQNEPHPDLPIEPSWEIEELQEFISKDESPTIAFYGGEPLLNIELIQQVMDKVEAEHYTIQTNGLLLTKISQNYLKRFSTILISLDGDEKITDKNRGEGIYKKIVENIESIRSRGFQGDLIARMAVSENSDIYADILHLLNTEKLTFDHVHWQIDCQWDDDIGDRWEDFPRWVNKYNESISKLVDYWLQEMREGEVKGIVPFLGIFKHILNETKTQLPCDAGLGSFAVRTDGEITFCPLPPEYEKSVVGNLNNSDPSSILNSAKISEPCPDCEVFDLCGGRCLFANLYKLWGREGFDLVCLTVKHLIKELKSVKTEVMKLIEKGIINFEDFDYPKYNNTTEIIP